MQSSPVGFQNQSYSTHSVQSFQNQSYSTHSVQSLCPIFNELIQCLFASVIASVFEANYRKQTFRNE